MVTRSKSDPLGRPYTRSETAFNADLREVLRMTAGFSALHVREADLPGVFDLLVTEKLAAGALPRPLRFLWLELKVGNEEVRPSQVNFHRDRTALGESCLIGRLRENHAVALSSLGPVHETEHLWVADFRTHCWDKTFHDFLSIHLDY